MSGKDEILELARRLGALGYAAVYTHTHGSPRDAGLRVAALAYRFLNGEDVDLINAQADEANRRREAHSPQIRVYRWPERFSYRQRKGTPNGTGTDPGRNAG